VPRDLHGLGILLDSGFRRNDEQLIDTLLSCLVIVRCELR